MLKVKFAPNLIQLREHPSAPSSPTAGEGIVYPKADGLWYHKNSAGVETLLSSSMQMRDHYSSVAMSQIDTLIVNDKALTNPASGAAAIEHNPRYDKRLWTILTAYDAVHGVLSSNLQMGGLWSALSSSPTATIVWDSDRVYLVQSVGSGDTYGYWYLSGFGFPLTLAVHPDGTFIVRTDTSISTIRILIGFFVNLQGGTDSLDSNTGAYIRYSTAASDAGWMAFVAKDATHFDSAQISSIATSTVYTFRIRITSGGVMFSVNGGAETALPLTNAPTGNVGANVFHKALGVSNSKFGMGRVFVEAY